MDPATIIALSTAGAGFLKGLFGKKSKDAQSKEQRRAMIAALTMRQKQSEDSRIGRLNLGRSILSGIPSTTAGGRVNTNINLDPGLLDSLAQERKYDFESAVPDETKGGVWGFLSGLAGGVADTLPYMVGERGGGAGFDPTTTRTGTGVPVTVPPNNFLNPTAMSEGADAATAGLFGADPESSLSIEDLLRLSETGTA